ncbi:MAG TPA: GNAT family N-acetyltransferase [Anaerolineales bacterium]|nr:GNAT family N-acetyltransferase [Anaerolineales bacterium]
MTPSIRRASPGDITAITALGDRVVTDTYAALTPPGYVDALLATYWTAAAFAATLASPGDHLLVALDGDGVCGMAEAHQADAESATLWKLYVAAHQQGRGLGRRLIDAIRAELIPTTLWLRTEYLSANARAAGFYTAQGFKFERNEVEWIGQTPVKYTYVRRRL